MKCENAKIIQTVKLLCLLIKTSPASLITKSKITSDFDKNSSKSSMLIQVASLNSITSKHFHLTTCSASVEFMIRTARKVLI